MEIFKCTLRSTTQPIQTLYENKRGEITRVSSSNHAKYRTRGFPWLQDADVVETTPRVHVTFGHYVCCATSGCPCVHPREPRGGSSDLRQPCYYCTTTKKKAREKSEHAQNILPDRATSGQVLFRSRDFVTSGQKAPLGRILCNFLLRMHITYFRFR